MQQSDLLQAVPPAPVRKKKVAVLGFTESWRLAPFDDPEWEIWGLNELYMFIPRWDRWFEIHRREVYEADKKRTSEHVERLKAMTCPLYMQQHWDDIPNSIPYPLDEMIARFGNYFTNSISYMTALAIAEGFEEIGIFGVDMAHDCLAPEMRVLTADLQWVRADELQVGQELFAFDEEPSYQAGIGGPSEFRKYRKTTVESLSRIVRPCRELTMADGTKLISSVGHKWLTLSDSSNIRRWQESNTLQAQAVFPNNASRIMKSLSVWDKPTDERYLVAAFDGIHRYHISRGLIQKFDADQEGLLNSLGDTPVLSNRDIEEREVVGIRTGTGTLIVEGFASHNSEYGTQRPSCEYFIGVARGMGIKVYIPPQADLMKCLFLYGYQEPEEATFFHKMKARHQELEAKINSLDNQIGQLSEARAQYRGAIQDCEHIMKIWAPSRSSTLVQ